MNYSEFVKVPKYLDLLKIESKNTEITVVKGKQFYAIVPLLLKKYPNLHVRDFLEIDNTFAIGVDTDKNTTTFLDPIELYLDTKDTLESCTYMSVVNTGFIRKQDDLGIEGFWLLLQ